MITDDPDLGLSVTRLIAGFAGGVVHAFAFKQTAPLAQVGSVVVGTFTANYLGPAAVHYLPWLGDGASAFLVGVSAMAIIQTLVASVQAKIKNGNGGGGK
jgi:hypothetical protein